MISRLSQSVLAAVLAAWVLPCAAQVEESAPAAPAAGVQVSPETAASAAAQSPASDAVPPAEPVPPAPAPAPPTAQPAASAPDAPLHARPKVHFSAAAGSDRQDLLLYLEKGIYPVLGFGGQDSATYAALCYVPCEAKLRAGTHVLRVSVEGRTSVAIHPPLVVQDGQRVEVRYQNRLLARIAGWTLLIGGTIGGSLLLGFSTAGAGVDVPKVATGAAIAAVSLVGGLWLANLPDRAEAWVVP